MTLTDWIMLALLAPIVGLDIWLALSRHRTISQRLRRLGRRSPSIPYAWGVLAGHIWGPPHDLGHWLWSPTTLLVSVVLMVWAGRYTAVTWLWALVWLAVGVGSGALLWGQ